jgi:uracil-DNA glycosylase
VIERLRILSEDLSSCTRCPLSGSRTQTVFGRGDHDADVVVVGEAPGAEEDARGVPFVGRSGKLLDEMMDEAGVHRYYVMNAVKCRPPENRIPTRGEVISCRPWFSAQLKLLNPRVLLALGKTAARALNISHLMPEVSWRGMQFEVEEGLVMVTFHPAYILRNPGSRKHVVSDIRKAHTWKSRSLSSSPTP